MFSNNNQKQALIDIGFEDYEYSAREVTYRFKIIRNRQNSLLNMNFFGKR